MRQILIILSLLTLISCSENIKYEILSEKKSMNVCRMQVKLIQEVNNSDLKNISTEIRESRKDFDKLWISFFKSDLLPDSSGNGAWAVASFTPNLELEILGEKSPKIENETEKITFPKFSNIEDMFKEANDFNANAGTLKIISNDKEIHVQVSKTVYKGDADDLIKEQTMRDIVYVAFQTFAQTDLDELTISSVPINDKREYIDKYKLTVKINREKAKKILNKYLKTESFQDLYQLNETMYLPDSKFDRLKNSELKNVFLDMNKK